MSKRTNPSTSLEAYHKLDPAKLWQIHQDIVRALKALGEANFEGIAAFLMVRPEKIWKRLNEAEKAGLIYKPGNTVLTKQGYKSYVYKAVQDGQPVEKVIKKSLPGQSVSDFSKNIQKIQQTLF